MVEINNKVKTFLQNWYRANFEFAELPISIADEIVEKGIQKLNEGGKNLQTDEELFGLFKKARNAKRDKRREKGSNTKGYHVREDSPWDLIEFKEDALYLDFGANQLRNINIFAQRYPKMKFIGMDIHKYEDTHGFDFPDRCEYFQVDKELKSFPKIDNAPDYIIMKLMLHHLESQEILERLLGDMKNIADEKTQIIIWEESYYEKLNDENIKEFTKQNNKNLIFTDYNLTKEFNDLNSDQKEQVLLINDMLLNYANPHMQWTLLYKSWEEWQKIFDEFGFKLNTTHHLGARINGKVQQGFHTIGIFTKKNNIAV